MFRKALLTLTLLIPLSLFSADTNLTGDLSYSPENPKPFSKVTVTLKSFSFDVDASNVSWYVDKVLVAKEDGKKKLDINLKEANRTIYVGVNVVTPSGEVFQKSVAITPHFVPLLIESVEGFSPPFYEGRSLFGEGARVKVVALPIVNEDSQNVPDTDLIYKWSVNTLPFSSAGGRGKKSFILRQDELEEESNIDVTVTSPSGETAMTERVTVSPYDLVPLYYEYDPLYGIDLSKGYESSISITKPTKVYFSPYNFAYNKQDTFFYWSLNGLPVTAESDFLLSLVPKENSTGQSTISIKATQSKKQLQEIDSTLSVSFDTTHNE